jgi:peptide/nickel transport system permease protein
VSWRRHPYRGDSGLTVFVRQVAKDRLALTGAIVLIVIGLVAIAAPLVAPYEPLEYTTDSTGGIASLQPPSWVHLLGTTNLGQDVFSQVVYGTRPALIVGLSAALLVLIIGTTIGILAGYKGGALDNGLMRVVDVAYAMPFEAGALMLAAAFGPSTRTLIIALTLLMWQSPARVARAQTLSYSQRPSVKAARCAGASDIRIILRHIAPNILGVNVIYVPIVAGSAIIGQSTVSFLGFGDPDVVNWGSIMQLAFATGALTRAWWWSLAPGAAIVLLVSAILVVGRPFEVVTNPRLRTESGIVAPRP